MSPSDSNPLDDLPEDVHLAFRTAGWIPGQRRRGAKQDWWKEFSRALRVKLFGIRSRSDLSEEHLRKGEENFQEFPAAKHILDEMLGLTVEPLSKTGDSCPSPVIFDPSGGYAYYDEIYRLMEIVHSDLVPVGELMSLATILLARTGHVFLHGTTGPGILLAGNSFGEAMSRILHGQRKRPIYFTESENPEREFQLSHLDENDPWVLRVRDVINIKGKVITMPQR